MTQLQQTIEAAFEDRANINPANASAELKAAVASVIADLDAGTLRVASRVGNSQNWETHQWIKKAVLLSFRLDDNVLLDGASTQYFDKVPPKFANFTADDFKAGGYRVAFAHTQGHALGGANVHASGASCCICRQRQARAMIQAQNPNFNLLRVHRQPSPSICGQ